MGDPSLTKRNVIAVSTYKESPRTQEDVGRFVSKTAVFDENTPIGIILDWSRPYQESPMAELKIYEDENTLAERPRSFDPYLLDKVKNTEEISSEAEINAKMILGRDLISFPPKNEKDAEWFLQSYRKSLKSSDGEQFFYLKYIKGHIAERYLDRANEFLKNPKPVPDTPEGF